MKRKIEWIEKTIPISDLKPSECNPRHITERGLKELGESFDEIGEAQPINIDPSGEILSGHARYYQLAKEGKKDVRCWVANRNLTEKEKKAVIVRMNKNIAGEWDFEKLANEFEIDDLLNWGFEENELKIAVRGGQCDEDEVPELVEDKRIKLGDLIELGNHRLMCGDSTAKENVEKLMNGEKADMVFTDPPYGMNLDTDYSGMTDSKTGVSGTKFKAVAGDGEDFSPNLIRTIFNNFGYCKEIFLFGADYYSEELNDRKTGSWIVWDKRSDLETTIENAINIGRRFDSCFELAWSKTRHKRDIARIMWSGRFVGNTAREHDKIEKHIHPTQKPVALPIWFFEKYGSENDLVSDVYLGSGTTLLACEKTHRKCFGMEIDPHYCAVIITRWCQYTGQSQIKINGKEVTWNVLTKTNNR